ncbi:OLC1v1013425C1 [Oldenlandia corymbosa var. corymbosa]|uniref:OLC1v1013425C1 n=1 Tax=Oldenlandia corymbosa var. corymbosa TaxID=529605 RepID=A0AAV1DYI6_OLDCO|nr:OLC1v1013425C1 [Oldenlandia corymbosa var. corymbosa]
MSDFDEDFDELEEIEVEDSSVPPLLDLPTNDSVMVDVQIETKDQDEKPKGQGRRAKVKKSPKRRRVTRNRSVVWAHFSKSTLPNGEVWATCSYCKTAYMADPKKHGTSSLHSHLGSCKVYLSQKRDSGQSKLVVESGVGKQGNIGAGASTTTGVTGAASASSIAGTTTAGFVVATSTNFVASASAAGSSADAGTAAAVFVAETSASADAGGAAAAFVTVTSASLDTGAATTGSVATMSASSAVDTSTTIAVGATSTSRIIGAATSGKSYESSSSDNDIEEIICDSLDNVSHATDNSVCQSVDEIKGEQEQGQVATPDANLSLTVEPAQRLVADVLKEAEADQQKFNHAWIYDKRGSASRRSKRNKGKPIPHGFHFVEKVDDGHQLRGIDFEGGDSNYAYLDYGAAVRWRIDLAKDRELLKSLIGREKKRSSRDQSKMLTPFVMRPSRINAFETKVVYAKFSSDLAKINNDVTIQCVADQEKKSGVEVSTIDDEADGAQESSVANASNLWTIKEAVESISSISSSQVQNDSGRQNSSSPVHNGQFQQAHKNRRCNIGNHTWRQRSSRSSGAAGYF